MKIVLHVCCGVCAAGVVERLTSEGHQVFGLFYNPNIHPLEEYNRRLEVAYQVAKELNFPLAEIPYTPEEWFKETGSLANEPEGGKRCEICFWLRLKSTCLYMEDNKYDALHQLFFLYLAQLPVHRAGVGERARHGNILHVADDVVSVRRTPA